MHTCQTCHKARGSHQSNYIKMFVASSLHQHLTTSWSCHVNFLSSLTVQSHAIQLNILTNQTAALCMYLDLKCMLDHGLFG